MRGGKIVKEKLKKKKHSGDSRDLSSARIDAPSNNNGKLKLKKRRHSSNLLRKIVESLNLSKQKSTNLKDVNDLNSESCSSSLSLKPEDDKSKTQSFSLNDNSTSRNNTLFEKNTSGIVKLNNDKKGPVTSEMYLTGNDSGYQKQMKKYINKLGQCKGQNLSPNKFLVILMKLFSIIEKHFNLGNTFDIDYAFSKFFTIERIQSILHKAATIFKGEPILLNLSATKQDIVVISDIHGSILDLIKVLSDNGLPESKTYLFLGNYVDKGTDDIAVVTLLLLLKICFPNNVYLLRGNHEFLDQNSKQCFPIRCKNYFGSYNTYRMFNYCFEFLPLAAIIDDDILCVHGGVSQWIRNRNSISSLIRPLNINKDIISRMIITDLVWADSSRGEYEFSDRSGFTLSKRGIGYAFNEYGLKNILEKLNVTRIIRGHQPCEEGYKIEYDHLCYTIHLRNLFEYYNSYGSYCIVKNTHNDELTVKSSIFIDLKKYSLLTQIPTLTTAANMCRNLISSIKNLFDDFKIEEQQTPDVTCHHCSDKSLYLDSLTSRKRTFVIHGQIKELIMSDRKSKKRNKNYQIFHIFLKNNNHIPVERFPLFLDLVYNNQMRDSQLISPEELELMNKVKRDIQMGNFQLNTVTFFDYNNLPFPYFNSSIDLEKFNEIKCEIRTTILHHKIPGPFDVKEQNYGKFK